MSILTIIGNRRPFSAASIQSMSYTVILMSTGHLITDENVTLYARAMWRK
ncbi:hypothetical protein [Clostridium thailandense]